MKDDDDSRNNPFEDIVDVFNDLKEVYDEHSHLIDEVGLSGGPQKLSAKDPLTEAHVSEDEVVIVAEAKNAAGSKMYVDFNDGNMEFELGGERYEVDIPNDVQQSTLSAEVNNGILRATMERENRNIETSIEVEDSTNDWPISDADSNENVEDDEGGDEDGSDG